MRLTGWAVWAVCGAAALAAADARAHAFGQRYDLPVPLGLYLLGAGAAVALSFVIMALALRTAPEGGAYPRANLLRLRIGRLLATRTVAVLLQVLGVTLFVLVVLTGLLGEQNPMRNLAPTFVWIIWWVGLAYVAALFGNLWVLLNPWRTVFAWADALHRRLRHGRELARHLAYPRALGVWPAACLFLAFAWGELVYAGAAVPAHLAAMVIVYSLVTWGGMWLFGRERWLAHGEAFSLAFGVLARFAPTEVRVAHEVCVRCELECRDRAGECVNCYECFRRARPDERELALRPFAVGLLRDERVSTSMIAFILLMLSTILFDGFMATPLWVGLAAKLESWLPAPGGERLTVIRSAGLLCFWLLFMCVYAAVSRLMSLASGGRVSTREAAASFAYTLVPIAIAYHLAHYLTYLLIQGQLIVPLASDPFGYGWNLFGGAAYRIDIAVVGARFAWYTAVLAIVAGHVIAVYLAHVKAARVLPARSPALRSQYPMTALMVLYTVSGLWVLAQPIVEEPAPELADARSEPALVRVPPDALAPEPGSGRLRAVGEGSEAALKLTYRAMTSSFHDGSRMTVADLLYPYAFAYRWGVAGQPEYDPQVDGATARLRERMVAVRPAGIDSSRPLRIGELLLVRELAIIEVYLRPAPPHDLYAAAIAPPWSSLPWQLVVLMEEAVRRGWAAFSREEARRRSVPWLDLVRDPVLAQRMVALVPEFARSGYRPAALAALVSEQEARARWEALAAFHAKHGHLLVTNGPYRLREWSPEAVVLDVFRDPTYPLGVGSYDAYAIPLRAHVREIARVEGGLRIRADVERVQKLPRAYEIVRQPLADLTPSERTKRAPVCRYVVIDGAGVIVLSGEASPAADGTFAVALADRLAPGAHTLLIALYVDGNTLNAEIKRLAIESANGALTRVEVR